SYTFTVHTGNNVAPWMNGINGTGEYTYYVSAGDVVNFTSTLSNDNPSEVMDIIGQTNIPSGYSATNPPTNGGTFSFNWNTNPSTPTGSYTYTLTANDGN